MMLATLPTAEQRRPPRRRRCIHHWTLSHEESEWTVSGYHIRSTCDDCGATTGTTRAEADAYIRIHQLPTRKTAR